MILFCIVLFEFILFSHSPFHSSFQYPDHDVSTIDYTYGGFDWTGGPDLTKGLGLGLGSGVVEDKVDYIQLQKILVSRCRVLGKDIQRARRQLGRGNGIAAVTTAATVPPSAPSSSSLSLSLSAPSSSSSSSITNLYTPMHKQNENGNHNHDRVTSNENDLIINSESEINSNSKTVNESNEDQTAAAVASLFLEVEKEVEESREDSREVLVPSSSVSLSTAVTVTTTVTATPVAGTGVGVINTNTNMNMPAPRCTSLALGLIWQDIASQTLTIPDTLLNREILDLLDSLLRDAGRFFLLDLGEDDCQWVEFMELQKVGDSHYM